MNKLSSAELIEFMQIQLSKFLAMSPDKIDIEAQFDQYGLDSSKAILMVGKLEDLLDVELPATLLWDYNNIKALADHLHENTSYYE